MSTSQAPLHTFTGKAMRVNTTRDKYIFAVPPCVSREN